MTTGGINLHIELERHKLDQIAARNIRMSLDKRSKASASPEENRTRTKYDIRDKNLPTVLANTSNRSRVRPKI